LHGPSEVECLVGCKARGGSSPLGRTGKALHSGAGAAHDTRRSRRTYLMSHIRRFDHVGITVADLDTVTAFFVGLGLEVEGRTFVEGEFVDTVIGIPGSRSHIVTLRPPNGGPGLELSSFVRP